MILIETVFQLVTDLLSKDKGGYTSNDEFNRYSQQAEQSLWQYYSQIFEASKMVPDGMQPFTKELGVVLSAAGRASLPADYGHWLQLWWNEVLNGDCGEEPTTTKHLLEYLEKNESGLTLKSTIRRPSRATDILNWEFVNAQIQVYPTTLQPSITLEYLRFPVYSVRAVTIDATNDQENYDAGATINYEWRDQDQNNLVDLILLQYGIVIRESDVIQFASNHKNMTHNITQ